MANKHNLYIYVHMVKSIIMHVEHTFWNVAEIHNEGYKCVQRNFTIYNYINHFTENALGWWSRINVHTKKKKNNNKTENQKTNYRYMYYYHIICKDSLVKKKIDVYAIPFTDLIKLFSTYHILYRLVSVLDKK
jgi:hypothetical protein